MLFMNRVVSKWRKENRYAVEENTTKNSNWRQDRFVDEERVDGDSFTFRQEMGRKWFTSW